MGKESATQSAAKPAFDSERIAYLLRRLLAQFKRPWLTEPRSPLADKLRAAEELAKQLGDAFTTYPHAIDPPIQFRELPESGSTMMHVNQPPCGIGSETDGYIVRLTDDGDDYSPRTLSKNDVSSIVATIEAWLDWCQNEETVGGDITTNAEQEGTPSTVGEEPLDTATGANGSEATHQNARQFLYDRMKKGLPSLTHDELAKLSGIPRSTITSNIRNDPELNAWDLKRRKGRAASTRNAELRRFEKASPSIPATGTDMFTREERDEMMKQCKSQINRHGLSEADESKLIQALDDMTDQELAYYADGLDD